MVKSIDEQKAELVESFEDHRDNFKERVPFGFDLDDSYHPNQMQFRERGVTGTEGDPVIREVFVNLEYMIEKEIGADRIQTKKMGVYKGQPKKWQVLDDRYFSRKEIEKIQIAIKAPVPDELEMYKEKHSGPMQLPINN